MDGEYQTRFVQGIPRGYHQVVSLTELELKVIIHVRCEYFCLGCSPQPKTAYELSPSGGYILSVLLDSGRASLL